MGEGESRTKAPRRCFSRTPIVPQTPVDDALTGTHSPPTAECPLLRCSTPTSNLLSDCMLLCSLALHYACGTTADLAQGQCGGRH